LKQTFSEEIQYVCPAKHPPEFLKSSDVQLDADQNMNIAAKTLFEKPGGATADFINFVAKN
jgi:hypothetical protein